MFQQHSPHSHRQYNSGCLHKQGRGYEIRPPVCPTVENIDLVHQGTSNSQSPAHSWPAELDSRQAIQTRADHSNRMVPQPGSFPSNMRPVAPAHSRPVCHQIQQQATTLCITGPRSPDMGGGCTLPSLDPYAFPPAAILGKVVEKLQDYPCNRMILIAPGWPNMPWFWDLVQCPIRSLCACPTCPT